MHLAGAANVVGHERPNKENPWLLCSNIRLGVRTSFLLVCTSMSDLICNTLECTRILRWEAPQAYGVLDLACNLPLQQCFQISQWEGAAGDRRSSFPMGFPDNDDGFADWQDPDAASLDESAFLDDPHHHPPHYHHHPSQVQPGVLLSGCKNIVPDVCWQGRRCISVLTCRLQTLQITCFSARGHCMQLRNLWTPVFRS